MNFQEYIQVLNQRFQSGQTTEHSFRGDLQQLLETILPTIRIINEPKRGKAGAPDYILMHPREHLALGYIEAKDIGKDITNKSYSEQFERYKIGLNNLIITDYLTFEFYYEGKLYNTINLGSVISGKIHPSSLGEYEKFQLLMQSFINKSLQSVNSAEDLAKIMANKAKLLANEILNAVNEDIYAERTTDLTSMLNSFREFLIHDLDSKSFSDIYAQTIVYGMFAARHNDDSLETFSRYEAANLIPHSNPFLRKLFGVIAGIDLDPRISWIVDDLVLVFRYTNVKKIMSTYGKSTLMNDPIIHFYETFLAEYDPKLRKTRGVWYTPQPVVSFIVRSVDEILKNKFDIKNGLSDSEKKYYEFDTHKVDKRTKTGIRKELKEFHRVQILDPATGTGTFLNEVIKLIYKKFEGMEGIWNQYVIEDLIPRLNGFELLMASYTMAHLKLDMLLSETGFNQQSLAKRLNIYLTNSLEEHDKDTGSIFSNWLSEESREASRIKQDTPVMVILGNPPYSGESANKGKWIMSLMEDYKKEPGGKVKLQEKNSKWINDDYVKFMRYGQHFIEKTGEGILAFINPHGFLDNPTFRGMRWNLLKAYDEIYIIDLHGNSKKKEVSPDGSPDINVFDIQQGVSINILVKTGKKPVNTLGDVFHFDLYGARKDKYYFLNNNHILDIPFTKIENIAPNYFFIPKDYSVMSDYDDGFSLPEIFMKNTVGIVTSRDAFITDIDLSKLNKRISDFFDLEPLELAEKYNIRENKSWNIKDVKSKHTFNPDSFTQINYRPFDKRHIYFSEEMIERPRLSVMQHFEKNENLGIVFKLGHPEQASPPVFISDSIIDFRSWSRPGMQGGDYIAPLYLYKNTGIEGGRVPNLNKEIINRISDKLNLPFFPEKTYEYNEREYILPINILDYIYATLHSEDYRKLYNEFLKTDFPKVRYPSNQKDFWELVEIGGKLRKLHLLDESLLTKYSVTYPKNGENIVSRKILSSDFEKLDDIVGRIWINDEQYFDNIPIEAWETFIGGYQPAQKWLKDRIDQRLSISDIQHYFKIVKALITHNEIIKSIKTIF